MLYLSEIKDSSKLNSSLSGTSNVLAILNIVLTVGLILTVSILAICDNVISDRYESSSCDSPFSERISFSRLASNCKPS